MSSVNNEVGMCSIDIELASLSVDPEIIYCGAKNNVYKYKYVMKILDLNTAAYVPYPQGIIHLWIKVIMWPVTN